MKCLMVAPFDTTGYGVSSVGYALALDAAGVDVTPRRLVFNNRPVNWPDRFANLFGKNPDSDILLMNSLPAHFFRPANFRKVFGAFCYETNKIPDELVEKLNLLDGVIVPCEMNKVACEDSGVSTPIYVVPFATDINKYGRLYNPPGFSLNKRGNFVFYTIGENTPRKNFTALLRAFTLEFYADEPVQLLVLSAGADKNALEAEFNEVKRGLKLYQGDQPKKEIVLTDFLPDEFVYALHQQCDCYVSTSRGEGWGVPTFEAKAFGNPVIASATGGHLDYLNYYELVPIQPSPCTGMTQTFPNLYTGEEEWDEISIPKLRMRMREVYEDYEVYKTAQQANRDNWLKAYSYETVGLRLKEILEG